MITMAITAKRVVDIYRRAFFGSTWLLATESNEDGNVILVTDGTICEHSPLEMLKQLRHQLHWRMLAAEGTAEEARTRHAELERLQNEVEEHLEFADRSDS